MDDAEGYVRCPEFEGDDESEVACDGTLAPHQTATCREEAEVLWALQSVQYEADSLIEFTLPIYDLPPERARTDATLFGGKGWRSEGIIVAFTDKNGNGQLDPGTPDKLADRVLSASMSFSDESYLSMGLVFLSEPGADMDEMGSLVDVELKQGYNIVLADEGQGDVVGGVLLEGRVGLACEQELALGHVDGEVLGVLDGAGPGLPVVGDLDPHWLALGVDHWQATGLMIVNYLLDVLGCLVWGRCHDQSNHQIVYFYVHVCLGSCTVE